MRIAKKIKRKLVLYNTNVEFFSSVVAGEDVEEGKAPFMASIRDLKGNLVGYVFFF